MTSTLLAAIVRTVMLVISVEAAPVSAATYTEAREIVTKTGKPLVVMVGTDWCLPCQTMKKTVLPRVRQRGLLKKVVFALVNADRQRELAGELTGGGPIPQLVMYRKTSKGWLRKKLVGGQSVEAVEEFISEGLAKDKAERQSSNKTGGSGAPPAVH